MSLEPVPFFPQSPLGLSSHQSRGLLERGSVSRSALLAKSGAALGNSLVQVKLPRFPDPRSGRARSPRMNKPWLTVRLGEVLPPAQLAATS